MNKQRTQINPGQKIDLDLTEAERSHILDDLSYLDPELEAIVRNTPPGQPIKMTLDDLDQLSGCVAAEANHTKNKKLGKNLDRIFDKIAGLLERYTDEPPPKTLKVEDDQKSKIIADQAVFIAEWVAKALAAADQLGIKKKPLEHFSLSPAQREVLLMVPGVSKTIKNKLPRKGSSFTVAEVASMTTALAEDLPDGEARKQVAVLLVAKALMDQLQDWIVGQGKSQMDKGKKKLTKKPKTSSLYQFKITLRESNPPIWRRIQVQDCTLDDLHEHIQTAMGWMNSHLHQFEIDGKTYGDPLLLEDDVDQIEFTDSTKTRLSKILPADGKRFQFKYEYDFGDSWQHEILFEGTPAPEQGRKYPLCLEGERACPPEDAGGIRGYAEFSEGYRRPQARGP